MVVLVRSLSGINNKVPEAKGDLLPDATGGLEAVESRGFTMTSELVLYR